MEEGDLRCSCGGIQYGYHSDNVIVFLCYRCGNIDCENVSKKVIKLFSEEPELVLTMIEDGFLTPISKV
jgi:hypothetical protein